MRKILYIFLVPLYLCEWVIDLLHKFCVSFHESVKELTLSIEKYINEPTKPKPSK